MMDRLQKKCWLASAGFHLSLALILIVGPAFFNPKPPKSMDLPVLDFIPIKTVDALASNSGGPSPRSATPPVPAPPTPPAYVPPVAPTEKAEDETKTVVKEPVKDTPKVSEELPRKPVISTQLVRRKPDPQDEAKAKADAEAKEEARLAAQARNRALRVLNGAMSSIRNGTSSATTISMGDGRGTGVAYANFYQAVKTVYDRAWNLPDGVGDDDATTGVSVTIARDGTVVSARIVRSSGNSEVDHSVQRALDRVTYAAPLPDDAKEDQRTVTISFNVRAKRAIG